MRRVLNRVSARFPGLHSWAQARSASFCEAGLARAPYGILIWSPASVHPLSASTMAPGHYWGKMSKR